MNRQEEVGPFAVGDGRALLQGKELVGAPRQDHVDARHLGEQLLEPQRNIEDDLRFGGASHHPARIVSAVAGIDHDSRYAQPELPRD